MLELKNISYVIDAENIKKSELKAQKEGNERRILDNFSYTFKDNCVTAITGHNGSGKSTLTKIIMGIVKPSSGVILYNGKDITNLSISERAKLGLNYAFQQPVVFKGITIKEMIDLATGKNNSVLEACEYLSKVGICAKDYISREFDKTLSGGEQKRIEIALALAKHGDTVIFDEPEAGIDLWSFDKLAKMFEKNKSYIIVSHQTRLLECADEIIVLNQGKIALSGKGKDVLSKMGKMACTKIRGEE